MKVEDLQALVAEHTTALSSGFRARSTVRTAWESRSRAHSVAAGQAVLFHQVFFQTICHDCFPSLFPDVQVAIGLAHLAGGRDLLQLREHVLDALHPHVAAAQAVDVVDALGAADARRVQAGP